MGYFIGKTFSFAASHQLVLLPTSHKCSRMHGHNYTVELALGSHEELDDNGFVKDYGDLLPFKLYIDTMLDHRHLNDIIGDKATAEVLAEHLHGVAKSYFPDAKIAWVKVQETANTFATYYGS